MRQLIFSFILMSIFSCSSVKTIESSITIENQKWQQTFNDAGLLDTFYTQKGALFIYDQIYQGGENIVMQLQDLRAKIEGIKFLGPIKQVQHDSLSYFDVGLFKDENKKNHAYLIAWKKIDNQWKKELEIISDFDETALLSEYAIAQSRSLWVQLSNSHDHRALIEQVYTPDAIYFNNGKIDQGSEAIVKRYAYMSDPGWQITLTPIQLLAVQDDMVFEIGQYKSGGVGHYVIVWTIGLDGIWKARLDFNF